MLSHNLSDFGYQLSMFEHKVWFEQVTNKLKTYLLNFLINNFLQKGTKKLTFNTKTEVLNIKWTPPVHL